MIPYSTQDISKADIKAVAAVLRSGWLTQGPALERFEKAIAKKVGAKFAVAFNSGTAALHAAYFAAGIGKGDEVVMPALTFAATANAALYLGASPVFADSDREYGNMSVADAQKKITKKTKAIVPVDYGGRPADLRKFRALAKKHRLVFIEDAAQALGAEYCGKPVGTQA
ncbi:MAG TPA: aminotransferase class I/II-fold pyridoxal phosphate-dependent enzyme, partial [Candidatus Paceibacterota bacterium]